jgi:glycerophosphoryl diester phosphodiesterase
MPTPLIIAHRGNTQGHHPGAPQENTIAAFNAAIASGANMIEFDVRTTQDGIHIIHHDPEIAGAAISQTTWLALHQANPHIPTLQQALETCRHRIALDIEIKETSHETSIVEAILAQYSTADFVVTSFQYPVLQRIRDRLPHLMIGYLLTRNRTNWFTQPIAQIQSQSNQSALLPLDYQHL